MNEKLKKKLKDLIEATRNEPLKWLLTFLKNHSKISNMTQHHIVKIVLKDIVGMIIICLCIDWRLRLKQCEMKNCTRIAFSISEVLKVIIEVKSLPFKKWIFLLLCSHISFASMSCVQLYRGAALTFLPYIFISFAFKGSL